MWGNKSMLASPGPHGPWRLGHVGVAVALRSRSPQTAAELASRGSISMIRFYSSIGLHCNVAVMN